MTKPNDTPKLKLDTLEQRRGEEKKKIDLKKHLFLEILNMKPHFI